MSAFAGIAAGFLDLFSQGVNNLERRNAAEEERLYNTPSNQVDRLLKAGINPYALAPQIAANNTSDAFPAGQLDVGGSVQKGVGAYQSSEQTKYIRALGNMQLQSGAVDIEGKMLDNLFKRQTLSDRVALQSINVAKAQLDVQLKNGIITRQQYDNEVARLNTDFVRWKSGQWSETFGDPLDTYNESPMTLEYGMDYDTKFAKSQSARTDSALKQLELSIRQKMRPFIEKEIEYKGRISEAQYNYWFNHALREEIAYKYEQSSNMPWGNKNIWLHLFESVVQAAKAFQEKNPAAGFWQSMWEGAKSVVGIKGKWHPGSSGPAPVDRQQVPGYPLTLPGFYAPGTFGVSSPQPY